MSTKEQVISIIDILPEDVMCGLLDYVQYLAYQAKHIPNEETLAAIAEVEEMKKNPHLYKGYEDIDEMMRDILQ